jgi:hypothetical protein
MGEIADEHIDAYYAYIDYDYDEPASRRSLCRNRQRYITPKNLVASADEFGVVGPTHDEFGNEL